MNITNKCVAARLDRFDSLLCFVAEEFVGLARVANLVDADVNHNRARLDEIATE